MINRGRLVVVDGSSGSGKDTLIQGLADKLASQRIQHYIFSEESVDENRSSILTARERGRQKGGTGDREMAEVLVTHRQQIYQQVVEPRIRQGMFVIANRGEPATLTYQTVRGELTMEEVWQKHRNTEIRQPDGVVIVTCSAETSLLREKKDTKRQTPNQSAGLSGKVSREPGMDYQAELDRRRNIVQQYNNTAEFLHQKRIPVLVINTERTTVPEEIEMSYGFVIQDFHMDNPV